VSESPHSSLTTLHKRWSELEDEHHELALAIGNGGSDLAPLRDRQAELLLEIGLVVAEIRDAPVTTIEDFAALLDVALEHELDLPATSLSMGRETIR
jgi:hypothetical protein